METPGDSSPESLSAAVGIPTDVASNGSPARTAGSATGRSATAELQGSRRSRPTPISPRVHGVLDYLTGGLLVAAPSLLGLRKDPAARWAPRIAGATHAGYSLLTRYELGVAKVLPMRAHLALDAAVAVALAASPWVFGSHRRGTRYWLPHALLGAYELATVALSDPGD